MEKKNNPILVRIPGESKDKLKTLASEKGVTQTEFLGLCINFFYENRNCSVESLQESIKKISGDILELKMMINKL